WAAVAGASFSSASSKAATTRAQHTRQMIKRRGRTRVRILRTAVNNSWAIGNYKRTRQRKMKRGGIWRWGGEKSTAWRGLLRYEPFRKDFHSDRGADADWRRAFPRRQIDLV